jgi:hypothetical protein
MLRWRIMLLVCAALAWGVSSRGSIYLDDIGYTSLKAEQGTATPTGAGVTVTQVEAALTDGGDDYFPDTTNSEFSNKTITAKTTPDSTSSHATTVGTMFYGDTLSMARGITSVNAYLADNWLADQFLNQGQSGVLPDHTLDRVANHSYIGELETKAKAYDPVATLDALHRLDYVIQHDDYINVVAENNPSNGGAMPLLADSFNAIAVGLTNGTATSGTTGGLDDPQGLYVANRAAPDVVAPNALTSFATPIVSSAAALLVDLAHNNPSLSAGSFTSPRTGLTLEYGETADVIKAAIMAGADRITSNTSTSDQITNYGASGHQTQNGLDTRYGAGQIDIYNSYHVIDGGQQGPGTIGTYGFDYNPVSSDTAVEDYTFTGTYGVAATLAWNVHIGDSLSASLAHFQLHLYQLVSGSAPILIAVSNSTIDNTQNIFSLSLDSADTYELEVTRTDALGDWDYGLAWDLSPVPEPGVGIGVMFGLMVMGRRRLRRG